MMQGRYFAKRKLEYVDRVYEGGVYERGSV